MFQGNSGRFSADDFECSRPSEISNSARNPRKLGAPGAPSYAFIECSDSRKMAPIATVNNKLKHGSNDGRGGGAVNVYSSRLWFEVSFREQRS